MFYVCAASFDVTRTFKKFLVCKLKEASVWFHSALFTSKIFYKIRIVALSFVFDKYCAIMD